MHLYSLDVEESCNVKGARCWGLNGFIIPNEHFSSSSDTCTTFQYSSIWKGIVALGEQQPLYVFFNAEKKKKRKKTQWHNKFFLVISLLSDERRSKRLCLGKRLRTSPWQFRSVSQIQPGHIIKWMHVSLKVSYKNKMSFQRGTLCKKEALNRNYHIVSGQVNKCYDICRYFKKQRRAVKLREKCLPAGFY